MPRILLLTALGALFAGCSGSAPTTGAEVPADPDALVVAEFAGQTLTLGEFEDRYARASGDRGEAADDSIGAYEDFLTRYVDFRLKVMEARRLGLDRDSALRKEIRDYRTQLAKPYFLEREVLEDVVRDIYEKQREEIAASHILLRIDEGAAPADTLAAYQRLQAIRDSIVAGQLDFAEAALRHSEDPSAAQNRGDLGFFVGGRMILAFEDRAYDTPVGEVSDVFRTRFGYHVLKVTGRRPASPEIRASHILLSLRPDAAEADSVEAYALAEQLQQRLDAGEDFATLARQYSDDPGSAERGGDLGFFARDRMVKPFADAAYALEEPGERSGIVRSRFGLHLIQLEERKPVASYEEQYEEIKRQAERLPRTTERLQAIGRAYRAEAGSTLDTALVRQAVAPYPADSLLARVAAEGFGEYDEATFATVGDSALALAPVVARLRANRAPAGGDQEARLFDLLNAHVNEAAVEMAALELEDRDPEFRRIMEDYADGVLLFRVSEDSVWSAASRDSVALENYYEANRARYAFPERRRVVAFYSRSDSLLQEIGAALDVGRSGAEIDEMIREAPLTVRVDTMRITGPSDSVFDAALALEAGGRTEPERYRSEQVLLYLDGVEAARPMTFEEARAQAAADYQGVLEERFVGRLRDEARVALYPERLRFAFEGEAVEDEAAMVTDDADGSSE